MLTERITQLKNVSQSRLLGRSILASSLILLGAVMTLANADIAKKEELVQPIVRINPSYPAQAIENNIEGFVRLDFDVDTRGKVSNIEITQSVPKGVFDESAKLALSQWKYANPTGETVSSSVQLDFLIDAEPVEKVSIVAN